MEQIVIVSIVFNVGVDTEIDFDDLICVGGEFEASSIVDDWSDSHTYLWSSESALIFGTETESSTTISTVTPLGAGVSEIYDIMLTVTNDVGCWEEETGEIEVYEVVAEFTIRYLSYIVVHRMSENIDSSLYLI